MNKRDFLVESAAKGRWKESCYPNFLRLAIEHYKETGEDLIDYSYLKSLGKGCYDQRRKKEIDSIISSDYSIEDLPLEYILMIKENFNLYDYYVILQKVKETEIEKLPQNAGVWKSLISKKNACVCNEYEELFNLLLEKGYWSVFLTELFNGNPNDSVHSEYYEKYHQFVKDNISKIADVIRDNASKGVRLEKETMKINEFFYEPEILNALADTGQLDSFKEISISVNGSIPKNSIENLYNVMGIVLDKLDNDDELYANFDSSSIERAFYYSPIKDGKYESAAKSLKDALSKSQKRRNNRKCVLEKNTTKENDNIVLLEQIKTILEWAKENGNMTENDLKGLLSDEDKGSKKI